MAHARAYYATTFTVTHRVRRAASTRRRACEAKMHVPSDCFQGMSPEVKASQALKNLFTMVAVRVVLAQEEGYDNEGAGTELSKALANFLHENPLRDGNEWLRQMFSHEDTEMRLLALRLLEVRKAYADGEFDFESVQKVAIEELTKDNDQLMSDYVKRSMGA